MISIIFGQFTHWAMQKKTNVS